MTAATEVHHHHYHYYVPHFRYAWLRHIRHVPGFRHFLHGLETDPALQYKVHIWAVRVWIVTMLAVAIVFTYAPTFWAKASVLFLVEISLYANLATDYGAASAAEAAGGLPGQALPAIPMASDPQVAAHYQEQQQVRVLLEQVAPQLSLLKDIHEHLTGGA